jgi:hypothetical protein
MIKFVQKNAAVIVFALTFVVDNQYGIIDYFFKDDLLANIVKLFGAYALAYFTEKGATSKIGGGGIKNPKPTK